MVDGNPAASARSRGLAAVLGVFVLGIVFGCALTIAILHLSGEARPFGLRGRGGMGALWITRMAQRLDLDVRQQAQIREILERSREDVHGVLDRTHQEIRALLRTEQREKFDRLHPSPPLGPGEPGPPSGHERPEGPWPEPPPPPP